MIDDLSVLLNIREAVLNALVGSGVEYIGAFENITPSTKPPYITEAWDGGVEKRVTNVANGKDAVLLYTIYLPPDSGIRTAMEITNLLKHAIPVDQSCMAGDVSVTVTSASIKAPGAKPNTLEYRLNILLFIG